jgi:endonuclease III
MAQETGYLSQSLVYKFFSGEIDMTSQKFIKLLGVISKCVKTTLVIAFDNEGNCLVKKNIPLIALMESDIF